MPAGEQNSSTPLFTGLWKTAHLDKIVTVMI